MPNYCFRKIADYFDQPCLLLDRERRILDANMAARRSLPLAQPSSPGRLYDLTETDRDRVDAYLRICSTGTIPKPGNLRVRTRAGGIVDYHCFAARYEVEGAAHPFLFLRLVTKWGVLAKLNQLNRRISEQHRRLHVQQVRHRQALADLDTERRRSRTDQLTGVLNRNAWIEDQARLERDWAAHNETPLVLAVIDLDGMKTVNDSFGHARGDELLQRFTRELAGHLREHDAVYRTGGDEFVCLLRGGELSGLLGGRLQEIIERVNLDLGLQAGVSMGCALAREAGDARELYRLADERMYAAKRAGKARGAAQPGRPGG